MEAQNLGRKIIESTFDRANGEIPGFEAEVRPDLALFDVPGALLDSLNLITFVFILEEEFLKFTGKKIKITTEDVLKTTDGPFRSVSGLEQFLIRKQNEL